MKPSAATAHLQGVQRRQEKIREEVDTIDYDKKLVYEGEFKEDSKLSGNPPYLEGCGPSVAVLCVPSGTTTTRYCLEGSCVLRNAASGLQFAIGRHKTTNSSHEDPVIAKKSMRTAKGSDVRPWKLRLHAQNTDAFRSCECHTFCFNCTSVIIMIITRSTKR